MPKKSYNTICKIVKLQTVDPRVIIKLIEQRSISKQDNKR